MIQVSNRRFVSTAQIQKCDHIPVLCASQCSCRASLSRAQSVQPVLHFLFCYVMFQSVQLFVHFHVVSAGSQAGYKWGKGYHAIQAKLVERERGGKPRNILSRPPPRLLRLVCCSMGWVCVSIQGCLIGIACI